MRICAVRSLPPSAFVLLLLFMIVGSAPGTAWGSPPEGGHFFPEPVTARMDEGGPAAAGAREFRAYWVDAFGPGLYDPREIDALVADARAAHMNALIVQVGRRGDCFCNRAIMPRTEAGIASLPFDPLQTLIEKAHAQGVQVHAWISATAIWSGEAPPRDPRHVFNTHGPSATGLDNWIMLRSDGADRGGPDYYLDPGHPAAAEYIVRMYTSIVANYEVDGVNLDRIRYPDYNLGSNEPSWGYNPVAVARFQAATGRSDTPAPDDPEWGDWRRGQITSIVRRIYLEAFAINPRVRVSADTITYGDGPQTREGWERTRPYVEVLQDWRGWMEEGILDLNIPMNYRRESPSAEPNIQRRAFEEWNDFVKDHQYRRQAAIGLAFFLNDIAATIAQVRQALAPSASQNAAYGWAGFSYRAPDAVSSQQGASGDAGRAELTRALTQPSGLDQDMPPAFASPAAVPDMSWKARPTTGHLRGTVLRPDGVPLDQARIDLYDLRSGALAGRRITDGSGWFGFVDLKPGAYKVVVDAAVARGAAVARASVAAGGLATVSLVLLPTSR